MTTYSYYNTSASQVFNGHPGESDVYYYNLGSYTNPNFVGNDVINNYEQGVDQIIFTSTGNTAQQFIDEGLAPLYYIDAWHMGANNIEHDYDLGTVQLNYANARNLSTIPVVYEAGWSQYWNHLNSTQQAGVIVVGVGEAVTAVGGVVLGPIIGAAGVGLFVIGTIGQAGAAIGEAINNFTTQSAGIFDASHAAGKDIAINFVSKDIHNNVDTVNYYYNNMDVASANLNAESHYNNYGWHEGRDPNQFFSTNGYLATNKDVAKAGLNPLTHYDQYGWKEGRDPSVFFDNEQYLKHNSDVAAAGIDPLTHYLKFGLAEGRQAYAAIGKASDFTHGSFDAEFYLLANPDVAKAALLTSDSFAFAYQHYESNGWHEGRAANAYFDTAYYLAQNPDIAAAHIDPLAHYDNFGWKEGRNASADFNTAAYLAANPDVAAAHIDPLTHYLQFGVHEGRHLA